MTDYERTKLTIGGETFYYDDETDEAEYRASLVPTAAVIPETLDHPEMLDMTHYQVWGITYGNVPKGDGVTVYQRIEDSVKAEKRIDEILDDPDLILKYAAIYGREYIPVGSKKPFEILDAQPEMKKRAILLLVNREGGVQPICRSKGEGYEILAIAEKTEKGVRLSGIIQNDRASERYQHYRDTFFNNSSREPKKDPPEQWAVLLRDIKEAATA